jgi:hypothetical protein
MARIAGVNLPREKRVEIGLTYIFGIGRSTSQSVLGSLEIDGDTKVRDTYLGVLKSGGSDYPYDILKKASLDRGDGERPGPVAHLPFLRHISGRHRSDCHRLVLIYLSPYSRFLLQLNCP